jgi:para-aminobenzoate synthetase component 1
MRCDAKSLVTSIYKNGELVQSIDDPFDVLARLGSGGLELIPGSDESPGRWVGFLSYDLGRLFERIPSIAVADLDVPLFAFAYCDASNRISIDLPNDAPLLPAVARSGDLSSTFTASGYRSTVQRVLDYIAAGDIFQANLSQRFTISQTRSPAHIYKQLLGASPARFGGLLDFGDFALICNSPELFLRVVPEIHSGKRQIVTRPIKGTRPRSAGMDLQLRDSVKDQAELNMIVDLERNDLGRVCEIGSVKVTQPRTIEAHPTVYHGTATIEGLLRPQIGLVDLLRAAFPGGSVTGAPKIRAMEIIEELERVRRGPYCGAIGYIAGDGAMEFNVAIRTMIVKDGKIHIPVGGGIVADSYPAAEYEETLVKARAMFAALGISAAHL